MGAINNFNDLELENKGWKKYLGNITTEGMWVSTKQDKFYIPDRDLHCNTNFHGVFIPEIVYQMLMRYTKTGDTVWDCFGGSGTTLDVCRYLNRECIINDLSPTRSDIVQGDSKTFDPGKNVQLAILHPPYHNIIRFSDKEDDISNFESLDLFYKDFDSIIQNVDKHLDSERFLILICGHIYLNGENIPLGYHCMEMIRKLNYKCKGIIVKDYGETKGGHKQRANLEYYRALRGGYWKFQGDNIFVLQKQKRKRSR